MKSVAMRENDDMHFETTCGHVILFDLLWPPVLWDQNR